MSTALHFVTDNEQTLIIDQQCCEQLGISQPTSDWFEPGFWKNHNAITGQAAGRGSTLFIHWQSADMILRRYCRGGAIRHISKDSYVFTGLEHTRAWQELTLLKAMKQQGLPVPTGIAARITRRSVFYQADLLCLKIPNAKDIHEVLVEGTLPTETWHEIGKTIRQLHNAQVYHHDLNIRNIMIDDKSKIWIIDFDKCGNKPGNRWKEANLIRLKRSLDKEATKAEQFHFSRDDWASLLKGYQNG